MILTSTFINEVTASFSTERNLFTRERHDGLYYAFTYLLAKVSLYLTLRVPCQPTLHILLHCADV